MAKVIYVAAFLVDKDDVLLRDAHDVIQHLSDQLSQSGFSDFIVWDSTDDMVADHENHGPIDANYLTGAEEQA